MTEITETLSGSAADSAVDREALPPAIESFVLKWGDLGGQWGVNRSVAQIHALLYASEVPLNAEQIAGDLGIARSNVSNSLRELTNWKLIQRVPVRGDRRDHFCAETDLWEIFRRIAAGRKAREIDPAAVALGECVAMAGTDARISGESLQRLSDMHDFVVRMSRWYDQMLSLPSAKMMTLVNLGSKVVSLVGKAGTTSKLK